MLPNSDSYLRNIPMPIDHSTQGPNKIAMETNISHLHYKI